MDGSKLHQGIQMPFYWLWSGRRIVLYDTLIEQMEIVELEAVLAHEIGHYKCGHIPKRLFFSACTTFLMFALIGWLIGAEWIFTSLQSDLEAMGSSLFIPAFLIISFGGLFSFCYPLWIVYGRGSTSMRRMPLLEMLCERGIHLSPL